MFFEKTVVTIWKAVRLVNIENDYSDKKPFY